MRKIANQLNNKIVVQDTFVQANELQYSNPLLQQIITNIASNDK